MKQYELRKLVERLQAIYDEVRPEISRVNDVVGGTIFNPCATGMVDQLLEIIEELE